MNSCEKHMETVYERLDALSSRADTNNANLEQACANINAKFATQEATELAMGQLLSRMDEMKGELEILQARFESERAQEWNRAGARPFEAEISTPPNEEQRRAQAARSSNDGAYPSGPGGQPMWNSSLPAAAQPGQMFPGGPPGIGANVPTGKAQSPLRSQGEPYQAPPPPAQAQAAQGTGGVQDHAGCLQSPLNPTQGNPTQGQGGANFQMPASWSRNQGDATPPWSGAQHHQRMHPQYQNYMGPQQNVGQFMNRPDFHGGNKVQFMGNREAMDKKSEALKRFSGNPGEFNSWANRFIDHMGRVHPDWKNTLSWISETQENLTFARLSNEVLGPWSEDACHLARQLEQTIIDYMPERIYNRRTQLCGGPTQKENGFILWRNLFKEHVGEKAIMEDAGVECLRTYGQCTTLQGLSAHIDGWYELLDNHCPEMRDCPRMLRSLFLGIIPKDLKSKILEDPALQMAGHRELAEWCRGRALILQREHLADVAKKNMSKLYGPVKSLQEENPYGAEETIPPPPWLNALIAAVRPKPPPKKGDKAERGRSEKKEDKPKRTASRSSSRGRRFLEGWGKRCNHCGSEDHIKRDCKEFENMMRKANPGKERKDWKPPEGYKSALGKARDAARAADQKRKVASLQGEDTASDDDDCDFGSEHGGTFVVQALTRHQSLPQAPQICVMNKFAALELDGPQEYDAEALECLNSWAHKVRRAPKKARKLKDEIVAEKATNKSVRSEEDKLQQACIASSTCPRAARKVGKWNLKNDEIVAIFDTGSFTHAIDAEKFLPDFEVEACDSDAPGSSAETAGGGVLRRLGTVRTPTDIDGVNVDIKWDHMRVNTPIISARKLVKEGNDVQLTGSGGQITHLRSGKTMKIHNFQGVYYLKIKIKPNKDSSPDFHRPGP